MCMYVILYQTCQIFHTYCYFYFSIKIVIFFCFLIWPYMYMKLIWCPAFLLSYSDLVVQLVLSDERCIPVYNILKQIVTKHQEILSILAYVKVQIYRFKKNKCLASAFYVQLHLVLVWFVFEMNLLY